MVKIEGVWMHGPWVMNNPYNLIGIGNSKKVIGDGECVAIAQQTLKMPHTSFWRPGVKVLGNDAPTYFGGHKVIGSGIAPGTVIATFVNKRYPSKIHGNHVAIYLEQGKNYIDVIDQWVNHRTKEPQYAHRRRIFVNGSGLSNDANAFSVVYTLTGGY